MRPPECKWKDRYTEDDRFATEHQVTTLVAAFVTALQPDYVLEVGSYRGQTTRAMGEALAANGQGHLDAVEITSAQARSTQKACERLPVKVHTMDFQEFTPRQVVDFAWIDAAMTNRGRDARRVLEFSRPGTILGLHDTAIRFKAYEAVQPLVTEGLVRIIYLPTARGVAFAEVLQGGKHGN